MGLLRSAWMYLILTGAHCTDAASSQRPATWNAFTYTDLDPSLQNLIRQGQYVVPPPPTEPIRSNSHANTIESAENSSHPMPDAQEISHGQHFAESAFNLQSDFTQMQSQCDPESSDHFADPPDIMVVQNRPVDHDLNDIDLQPDCQSCETIGTETSTRESGGDDSVRDTTEKPDTATASHTLHPPDSRRHKMPRRAARPAGVTKSRKLQNSKPTESKSELSPRAPKHDDLPCSSTSSVPVRTADIGDVSHAGALHERSDGTSVASDTIGSSSSQDTSAPKSQSAESASSAIRKSRKQQKKKEKAERKLIRLPDPQPTALESEASSETKSQPETSPKRTRRIQYETEIVLTPIDVPGPPPSLLKPKSWDHLEIFWRLCALKQRARFLMSRFFTDLDGLGDDWDRTPGKLDALLAPIKELYTDEFEDIRNRCASESVAIYQAIRADLVRGQHDVAQVRQEIEQLMRRLEQRYSHIMKSVLEGFRTLMESEVRRCLDHYNSVTGVDFNYLPKCVLDDLDEILIALATMVRVNTGVSMRHVETLLDSVPNPAKVLNSAHYELEVPDSISDQISACIQKCQQSAVDLPLRATVDLDLLYDQEPSYFRNNWMTVRESVIASCALKTEAVAIKALKISDFAVDDVPRIDTKLIPNRRLRSLYQDRLTRILHLIVTTYLIRSISECQYQTGMLLELKMQEKVYVTGLLHHLHDRFDVVLNHCLGQCRKCFI